MCSLQKGSDGTLSPLRHLASQARNLHMFCVAWKGPPRGGRGPHAGPPDRRPVRPPPFGDRADRQLEGPPR
eukprot:scaffold279292_cov40-Prasinocladus_malaysianus.AAC.1